MMTSLKLARDGPGEALSPFSEVTWIQWPQGVVKVAVYLFIVQHFQGGSCTWYVPNANSSRISELCTFSVFWVSASITFSMESIFFVLETSLIPLGS